MQSLTEKYRPKQWAEFVGQPDAIALLDRLRQRYGTIGGRAYWISGKTGQGKSSLALLIAGELAESWNIYSGKQWAGDCIRDDQLEEIERSLQYRAMGDKPGKVWIIDEAHGLSSRSIRSLNALLEQLGDNGCIIFTTTKQGEKRLEQKGFFECGEDPKPLMDRCKRINLEQRNAPAYAPRLKEIAMAEGLDGQPEEAYLKLLRREDIGGSMRAALEAIESGEMLE